MAAVPVGNQFQMARSGPACQRNAPGPVGGGVGVGGRGWGWSRHARAGPSWKPQGREMEEPLAKYLLEVLTPPYVAPE